MARFLILFILIQGVLFGLELTPPAQQWLIQPFTSLLAVLSSGIIELLGRDVLSVGVVIWDRATGFGVEIAAGCNGVEAMILLLAAILAFPGATWRYRLSGLAIGFVAIQGLNLVRIVSLFYLGLWNETAFEWAHLYVWQALIMLDALVVFLVWVRRMPRSGQPADGAGQVQPAS